MTTIRISQETLDRFNQLTLVGCKNNDEKLNKLIEYYTNKLITSDKPAEKIIKIRTEKSLFTSKDISNEKVNFEKEIRDYYDSLGYISNKEEEIQKAIARVKKHEL